MMDYFDRDELLYYCSGLRAQTKGTNIADETTNGNYVKGEDCIGCVKDLIYALRRDDPERREVYKTLGGWFIVKTDLIPIIQTYHENEEEKDLMYEVMRLLVMLTQQPPTNSFDVPKQTEYLQMYKEAFSNSNVLSAVLQLLSEPLAGVVEPEDSDHDDDDEEVEDEELGGSKVYDEELGEESPEERKKRKLEARKARERLQEREREKNNRYVELVLSLFRNLLSVPDTTPSQSTFADHRARLHDTLIKTLENYQILELLIILGQEVGDSEQKQNQSGWNVMLLLEIYYLLLRKEDPQKLWIAFNEKDMNPVQRAKNSNKLGSLLAKEEAERNARTSVRSPRHPRFGGTFAQTTLNQTTNIINRTVSPVGFSRQSPPSKAVVLSTRGLKKPAPDENLGTLSSPEVQLILKNFAESFLDTCYNTFMRRVKKDILASLEAIDSKLAVGSDHTNFLWLTKFFLSFSYLAPLYNNNNHHHNNNNKDAKIDVASISCSIDKPMFQYVFKRCDHYQTTKNFQSLEKAVGTLKEMMQVLHSLAQDSEYKHIGIRLQMKVFFNKSESLDKIVDLVKDYDASKQVRGYLVDLVSLVHVTISMLEKFSEGGEGLYVMTKRKMRKAKPTEKKEGKEEEATSSDKKNEGEEEEEEEEEVGNKEKGETTEAQEKTKLRGEEQANPDSENKENQSPNIETTANKTDPGEKAGGSGEKNASEDVLGENNSSEKKNASEESNEGNNNAEEESNAIQMNYREAKLNFLSYLNSFANSKVISNYNLILRDYKTNPKETNDHIISLFKKIADISDLEPMLYQLSVFQVFHSILDDRVIRFDPNFKDMISFTTRILEDFFKKLDGNPLLFPALLFWKTKGDCILFEKGSEKDKDTKKGNGETRGSKSSSINLQDSDGENYYSESEGEGENENLGKTKNKKKNEHSTKLKMREWTQEEDTVLKNNFSQHSDSDIVIDLVTALLDNRTSAEVYKRLNHLGVLTSQHHKKWDEKYLSEANQWTQSDNEREGTAVNYETGEEGAIDLMEKIALDGGKKVDCLKWLKEKIEEQLPFREEEPYPPMEIIPMTEVEWAFFKSRLFKRLLKDLKFAAPKSKKGFWAVPNNIKFSGVVLSGICKKIEHAIEVSGKKKKKKKGANKNKSTQSTKSKDKKPKTNSESESENKNESESESEREEEAKKKKETESEKGDKEVASEDEKGLSDDKDDSGYGETKKKSIKRKEKERRRRRERRNERKKIAISSESENEEKEERSDRENEKERENLISMVRERTSTSRLKRKPERDLELDLLLDLSEEEDEKSDSTNKSNNNNNDIGKKNGKETLETLDSLDEIFMETQEKATDNVVENKLDEDDLPSLTKAGPHKKKRIVYNDE